MDAGRADLDVDIGDVANDIGLIVNHCQRCKALVVHQLEGFLERFVATGPGLAVHPCKIIGPRNAHFMEIVCCDPIPRSLMVWE